MRYKNLVKENLELKHEIEILKKKNKRIIQVIDTAVEVQMMNHLHRIPIEVNFNTLLQIRENMEEINNL